MPESTPPPTPRWSGCCSHRHRIDDATGTPRVPFGGAAPGPHPLAPSPFLPPLLASGIRRERGSSDPQPRVPSALGVAGRSGKGAEAALGRELGSAIGWKGGGGKPGGARRVGPALPMINVVMCGRPVKADRKSPTSSRNTLCTKTSLERSAGNRRLPGARACLACSAEFLGPSYLRTTPKINFRDTSPCKKVGSSRGT